MVKGDVLPHQTCKNTLSHDFRASVLLDELEDKGGSVVGGANYRPKSSWFESLA